MSTNILVFFPILLIFAGVLALYIWVIRYVYRDANARGMNGALWALIVFLLQLPVGPLVYLVARSADKGVVCPHCGQRVETGYPHCPHCGEQLQATCSHCGALVGADWRVCSRCGTELGDQVWRPVTASTGGSDKKLLYVIVAIVAVPLVLVMLAVFVALMSFMVIH